MKPFVDLEATCILDKTDSFLYANDIFLSVFGVSQQNLYQTNISDYFYDPILIPNFHHIKDLPFTEHLFKRFDSKQIFSAFISITSIPSTGFRVLSIKKFSKQFFAKRAITSFRRYVDSQTNLISFKFEDDHMYPILGNLMNMVDDDPSFMINLSNEIYQTMSSEIPDISQFSGIFRAKDLQQFQNFSVFVYVFHLMVPSKEQKENDYITETYIIASIFPSFLESLFNEEEQLRKGFQEHVLQINSPLEITDQFLEELKQKVILAFNSQLIGRNDKDHDQHNFHVLYKLIDHLPLNKATDVLVEFCVRNFNIKNMNVIEFVLEKKRILNSTFNLPLFDEIEEFNYLLEQCINSTLFIEDGPTSFTFNNNHFIILTNKKKTKIFGLLQIELKTAEYPKNEIKNITFRFRKLLETYQSEEHLLKLQALSKELFSVPDITAIFETIAQFIQRVYRKEFRYFSVFLFNPETNSLDSIVQLGYSSNLKDKAIGLQASKSIVAKSARVRRILNIANVNEIDYYLEENKEVKSELAVPLLYNEQLLGVLNVESPKIDGFSSTFHVPLIKIIGDMAISAYVRLAKLDTFDGKYP